ncbi:MAG TPA: thiamine biosynthesis protein ThiF [Prolixibacteraceae bacterium]|nr:thiamine biosynthesis protein ThiF [Prolixibacteraceae bacterium]
MKLQLRISGFHYEILKKHLLNVESIEAVAVALCGRFNSHEEEILLVHDMTLIPHDEYYSTGPDILHWQTDRIHHYFERIGKSDLALLKIHSHPGGFDKFSETDDESDKEFFDSAFGWALNDSPHASAVMLPDGKIFGRFYFHNLEHSPIDKILIAGDTIQHFSRLRDLIKADFAMRTIQAFGEKTFECLNKLSVGVVGCSGTGSPVIEQLVRLGVKRLILIDPDIVETKNLNRIINSTVDDVESKKPKVLAIADAVKRIGLGTKVDSRQVNIYDDVDALKALIQCEVVFGCMDSVDGRHLLNQLCSFYLIPYFDLGVKLEADGLGGIKQICGSVHYLQPCMSSLLTRGVYTIEDLRASSQYRKNPEEFENLKKNSYIKNVNVNSPAVISVNMQVASHAINEFLNRIHPYRSDHPSSYAASTIDISECYIVNSNESDFEIDTYLRKKSGRGDMSPFIEMSELNS